MVVKTVIKSQHAVRNLCGKEADSSEIIDAIKRQYDLLTIEKAKEVTNFATAQQFWKKMAEEVTVS
jgi:hypothetical protein